MINIHVIGNCQVRPVAAYLGHALGNAEHLTVWPELHLIEEAECSQLIDSLENADVLVCMPVGDNYRSMPLGSSQLAEQCPPHCKVVIYPNSYFRGYHPTFDYARDNKGNHILPTNHVIKGVNPFADYHDSEAARLCLSGDDDDMVFEEYAQRLHLITKTLNSIVSDSLAEIERRDASCSFSLHPIIKTQYQKNKLFHSFNHPTNALMKIVAWKILEEAGLAFEDGNFSPVSNDGSEFLGHPNLPIMPSIYNALNLEFAPLDLDYMKQQYFQYFSFIRMNREIFSSAFLEGGS